MNNLLHPIVLQDFFSNLTRTHEKVDLHKNSIRSTLAAPGYRNFERNEIEIPGGFDPLLRCQRNSNLLLQLHVVCNMPISRWLEHQMIYAKLNVIMVEQAAEMGTSD
jgi:hypothetical protein